MLLRLEGLEKRFGDRVLFAGVELEVRAGDRIGLVGPNGAGKTTLLRIAAGLDAPDGGRCVRARGARVAFLRQEIDPSSERSVREEAASAFATLDALAVQLRELEALMAEQGRGGRELDPALAERYDRLHARFEHGGGFERDARVERVLAGLGFDPADRARPLRSFSGGWLMRVELAKLLLAEPDVLLLDEPTNHLDLPTIEWFEETLTAFAGGVLVVSHDRTLLRRHAGSIAALEHARLETYAGGFDRYLEERARRREELEARRRTQQRQVAQTERFIERFRYKASKARQVQSRIKALEKLERVGPLPESRRRMRLRIPTPARAGAVVLALAGIHKRYGETRVYEGLDFELRRGDRTALVGPNGAGKSTLLRIAAGVLPFESGERRLGHNVRAAFFAQHQLEALTAEASVLEELAGVAHTDDVPRLRSHLGAFLFSGDDVEKKVAVLSGGEKARLALAKLLLRPANLLVLDEPTNHLDVEACAVLEEALRSYAGTLLFISHDRAFIDAIASRVVEIRAGRLREFLGGFEDYRRALAAGDGAAGPGSVAGHGRREPAPERAARRAARHGERSRERERVRLRRQIERLEGEILAREEALEALGWRLGEPAVHRDGEQVRALEAERAAVQLEVRDLYRRWEALAKELEEIEGQGAPG